MEGTSHSDTRVQVSQQAYGVLEGDRRLRDPVAGRSQVWGLCGQLQYLRHRLAITETLVKIGLPNAVG